MRSGLISLGERGRVSSRKPFQPLILAAMRQNAPHPGYRKSVGICLIDTERRVFAGRRCRDTEGLWQLPQGGIDDDESIEEAALRELKEETGITRARILGMVDGWLAYDFQFMNGSYVPPHLQQFKGQSQKWVLMQFEGQKDEVDLKTHDLQEFQDHRWMDFKSFLEVAVPFKKTIYTTLEQEFGL